MSCLEFLPEFVIRFILEYITFRDRLNLRTTSKRLYDVVTNNEPRLRIWTITKQKLEEKLNSQDGDTIPDFILDSDEDICLQVDLEDKEELYNYNFQKFAHRIVEFDLSFSSFEEELETDDIRSILSHVKSLKSLSLDHGTEKMDLGILKNYASTLRELKLFEVDDTAMPEFQFAALESIDVSIADPTQLILNAKASLKFLSLLCIDLDLEMARFLPHLTKLKSLNLLSICDAAFPLPQQVPKTVEKLTLGDFDLRGMARLDCWQALELRELSINKCSGVEEILFLLANNSESLNSVFLEGTDELLEFPNWGMPKQFSRLTTLRLASFRLKNLGHMLRLCPKLEHLELMDVDVEEDETVPEMKGLRKLTLIPVHKGLPTRLLSVLEILLKHVTHIDFGYNIQVRTDFMSKLAPLISFKLRHITVKLDEYVNDDMFNGVVNLLKKSQISLQILTFSSYEKHLKALSDIPFNFAKLSKIELGLRNNVMDSAKHMESTRRMAQAIFPANSEFEPYEWVMSKADYECSTVIKLKDHFHV
eukprot:TRINITY_DN39497_c0_g1_i5.p1 TRINITY_DN39497_c0_g1~~TRINITY_DN39497_c0_g1_i5.p1  ORF type:complete len:535 (-),score=100.56 TRINITY_DN39497_c0_g1_i5:137-1741(-)